MCGRTWKIAHYYAVGTAGDALSAAVLEIVLKVVEVVMEVAEVVLYMLGAVNDVRCVLWVPGGHALHAVLYPVQYALLYAGGRGG